MGCSVYLKSGLILPWDTVVGDPRFTKEVYESMGEWLAKGESFNFAPFEDLNVPVSIDLLNGTVAINEGNLVSIKDWEGDDGDFIITCFLNEFEAIFGLRPSMNMESNNVNHDDSFGLMPLDGCHYLLFKPEDKYTIDEEGNKILTQKWKDLEKTFGKIPTSYWVQFFE